MNSPQNPICPICQRQLKSVGQGDTYAFYECPTQNSGNSKNNGPNPPSPFRLLFGPGQSQDKTHRSHYFIKINPKEGGAIERMQVDLPGFLLNYANGKTLVYKVHQKNADSYLYAFTLDGQFPIDWNDLQHSADRLKDLIVFS